MLFKKSTALVYLSGTRLEVKCSGVERQIDFTDSVVNKLEVKDPAAYKKLLIQLFDIKELKGTRAIVLVADDAIFSVANPANGLDALSLIPLNPDHIISKSIVLETGEVLLALNKELLSPIIDVLRTLNCKVDMVLPAQYVHEQDLANTKDLKSLNSLNFLARHEGSEKSGISRGVGILAAILIIETGVMFVVLAKNTNVFSFLVKHNTSEKSENTKALDIPKVIEATQSSESTQSMAEAGFIDLADLKVLVFNGSRIPGQAGKVKELLINLGILDVSTDNTSEANTGPTTILIQSLISPETKDSILTELGTLFTEIEVTEATESSESADEGSQSDADIIITTGQQ